jgi:hypothetical protein
VKGHDEAMSKLSTRMTLRQFDHGYWYATEIKRFARSLGVPAAQKLRKDELEKVIGSIAGEKLS